MIYTDKTPTQRSIKNPKTNQVLIAKRDLPFLKGEIMGIETAHSIILTKLT